MKSTIFILLFIFSFSFQSFGEDYQTLNEELAAEFQYPVDYKVLRIKKKSASTKRCNQYTLRIKTDYPNNPNDPVIIDGVFYFPMDKKYYGKPSPLIVQLVPMGGETFLDRWLAKSLCHRGFSSIVIRNDFTGFDGKTLPLVSDHDEAFRRTVASTKALVEFAKDKNYLDHNHIGLFGASLGGILGSFTHGVTNEISAGSFFVAGGDVPYILAYSQQKTVKKLRTKRSRALGFRNNGEYEDYLRDNVYLDPLNIVTRIPSNTTYLVVSTNDTSVPSARQWDLLRSFNHPAYKVSNKNHVMTIANELFWPKKRRKLVNFFRSQFKKENSRIKNKDSIRRN